MEGREKTGSSASEKSPLAPEAEAGVGLEKVFEIIDGMDVPEPEKTIAKLIALMGGNPTDVIMAGLYKKETAESERLHPRKPLPEDYTETERILHEMLIENTGAHPLDSGGIYGRPWERNREIDDFRKTPEVYVDEDVILINVFHYLRRYLERDETSERLERLLYEFAERPEKQDSSWLKIMMDFADELEDLGWTVYPPFNTYNFENFLSQELQGIVIESKKGSYIILQIHNGCDIRGGYTKPRVFKLVNPEEFDIHMCEVLAECDCKSGYIDEYGYHDFNPDSDDEDDDDEDNELGLPKDWQWDEEEERYVCRKCGKPVTFS